MRSEPGPNLAHLLQTLNRLINVVSPDTLVNEVGRGSDVWMLINSLRRYIPSIYDFYTEEYELIRADIAAGIAHCVANGGTPYAVRLGKWEWEMAVGRKWPTDKITISPSLEESEVAVWSLEQIRHNAKAVGYGWCVNLLSVDVANIQPGMIVGCYYLASGVLNRHNPLAQVVERRADYILARIIHGNDRGDMSWYHTATGLSVGGTFKIKPIVSPLKDVLHLCNCKSVPCNAERADIEAEKSRGMYHV